MHVTFAFPSLTTLSKACPLRPAPRSTCPTHSLLYQWSTEGPLPIKEVPLQEVVWREVPPVTNQGSGAATGSPTDFMAWAGLWVSEPPSLSFLIYQVGINRICTVPGLYGARMKFHPHPCHHHHCHCHLYPAVTMCWSWLWVIYMDYRFNKCLLSADCMWGAVLSIWDRAVNKRVNSRLTWGLYFSKRWWKIYKIIE